MLSSFDIKNKYAIGKSIKIDSYVFAIVKKMKLKNKG